MLRIVSMEPPGLASRTTIITSLVAILLAGTLFSFVTVAQPSQPKPLVYSLNTDDETYYSPDVVDAYLTVTNRNPYPMNVTGFGEVTWSSRYSGEEWYSISLMGDWAFSPTIPANTTKNLTSHRFSAPKPGEFEMKFSASGTHIYDCGKVVKVVAAPDENLTPRLTAVLENATTEAVLNLIMFNPSHSTIYYGYPYQIEKMMNGTWSKVPFNGVWILPLMELKPGDTYHQNVDITGLDSGHYRISKNFERQALQTTLYAEFEIYRPKG